MVPYWGFLDERWFREYTGECVGVHWTPVYSTVCVLTPNTSSRNAFESLTHWS